MEDKIKNALDNFVETPENESTKDLKSKTLVLNEREGLIERLDKQYVTSDGRILLRERY